MEKLFILFLVLIFGTGIHMENQPSECSGGQEGESVVVYRKGGLIRVCEDGVWVLKQRKSRKAQLPCEDDPSVGSDFCEANQGHCLQETEMGLELEANCSGTCGSCEACRCQDKRDFRLFCPAWVESCGQPGFIGIWMANNCRKTCNKCNCGCCSYQGIDHQLGDKIPLPDLCGFLVCEEGLVAPDSPPWPGAGVLNISHPERLTLNFQAKFYAHGCCLLPQNATSDDYYYDYHEVVEAGTMVPNDWEGTMIESGELVSCCHGQISVAWTGDDEPSTSVVTNTTENPETTEIPDDF
eukprot:GFUD01125390.1.p1 GENE.GFUD01125390.1~~GFUD01125390.1.p1  ORF type:complete len:303 (+),score=62.28 GFUD01125390.1:22-909(+)